jgi:hypothetical protein
MPTDANPAAGIGFQSHARWASCTSFLSKSLPPADLGSGDTWTMPTAKAAVSSGIKNTALSAMPPHVLGSSVELPGYRNPQHFTR